MTTDEIADRLNSNKWYQKQDSSIITAFQIHGRTRKYSQLFTRSGNMVFLAGQEIEEQLSPKPTAQKQSTGRRSTSKDEHYVLDLCDAVLNSKSIRQYRFNFLRGDVNSRGKAAKLPIDAYYEELKLVIEYRERQHTESVPFFDKPNRMTVSGVHRGAQRKKYDDLRRVLIPQNGLKLIEISYADFNHGSQKRIIRNIAQDIEIVRRMLSNVRPLGKSPRGAHRRIRLAGAFLII